MHVDPPVADLVVDEPLLEQVGVLEAWELKKCASICWVEGFQLAAVTLADFSQFSSNHLIYKNEVEEMETNRNQMKRMWMSTSSETSETLGRFETEIRLSSGLIPGIA